MTVLHQYILPEETLKSSIDEKEIQHKIPIIGKKYSKKAL
jgi:hypothetical protein